mgnify:CR=1 FL=1|tara:strand:- start:59877 stop:62858 length:2982 start_codon:yes stop_codon:yes gene_type:complete
MQKFLPINIDKDIDIKSNRWIHILDLVSSMSSSRNTREDLLKKLNLAIEKYLDGIDDYIGDYIDVLPNTHVSATKHGNEIQTSAINSRLLYTEFSSLRSVAIGTFNRIATERQNLLNRIARISGKVRTLDLYNIENYRGKYVGEAFTSLDTLQLETGSALLNVDIGSGIVTLPVKESVTQEISNIIIDYSFSNGNPGNNMDTKVAYNYNDLTKIVDEQPNTWWEYETLRRESSPLDEVNLSLVMTLARGSICNRIEISLLNLGTLSEPEIISAEGSIDGTNWRDLTQDMPIASYRNETREDLLKVTPATGGISSNSVSIYFNPLPLKMVRIRMSHSEPMIVRENLYRYAIGVKGISVHSDKYSSSGELTTKNFPVEGPVNTLLLLAAMSGQDNIFDREFAIGINGNRYVNISPAGAIDLDVDEVVNTLAHDINPGSVGTLSMRFKLIRDDDAFLEDNPFEDAMSSSNVEVLYVNPNMTPIVFSTAYTSQDESIMIMETPTWSVGGSTHVASGGHAPGQGTTNTRIWLPIELTPDFSKPDHTFYDDILITVNGSPWSRVNSLAGEAIDAAVYEFRQVKGRSVLVFGNSGGKDAFRQTYDDTETGGMALPTKAEVEMHISPELMSFIYNGNGYRCELNHPYDGDKNSTIIENQSKAIEVVEEVIKSKTHQLKSPITGNLFIIREYNANNEEVGIHGYEIGIFDVTTGLTIYKTYVESAPTALGEFSLDTKTGILTAYSDLNLDHSYTITYSYYEMNALEPTEFSLIKDDEKNQFVGVYIPEASFKARNITVDLNQLPEQRLLDASSFGNISTEFDSEETSSSPQFFPTKTRIYEQGGRNIYLSHANIIRGTVHLNLSTIGGETPYTEVEYIDGISEFKQLSDTLADLRVYSIDYRRGLITFPHVLVIEAATIPSDATVSYQYAQYRCSYNVCDYVSAEDVKINKSSVSINGEALTGNSRGRLRIAYDFNAEQTISPANLAELYTPILRDAQLRYD